MKNKVEDLIAISRLPYNSLCKDYQRVPKNILLQTKDLIRSIKNDVYITPTKDGNMILEFTQENSFLEIEICSENVCIFFTKKENKEIDIDPDKDCYLYDAYCEYIEFDKVKILNIVDSFYKNRILSLLKI